MTSSSPQQAFKTSVRCIPRKRQVAYLDQGARVCTIEGFSLQLRKAVGIDDNIVSSEPVLARDTFRKDRLVVSVDVERSQGDLGVLWWCEPAATVGGRVATLPALQIGVLTLKSRASSYMWRVRVEGQTIGREWMLELASIQKGVNGGKIEESLVARSEEAHVLG